MSNVPQIKKNGLECPSEHMLDLYVLEDLEKEESDALAAHIEQCSICSEKTHLATLGFDAYPDYDTKQAIDRLHQLSAGLDAPPWVEMALGRSSSPKKFQLLRLWRFRKVAAVLGVLIVGVLALFLHNTFNRVDDTTEFVRAKGGLKLEVLRSRAGSVEEILSGEHFREGDRLRFRVSLPHEGYVMVVGVEQNREVFPCYPIGGKAKKLSNGRDVLLPGAVQLDHSRGKEWLHLILCRSPFSANDIRPSDTTGGIRSPQGCISDSFEMHKVQAK